MKQSRFTEAQIVAILQEADTPGVVAREVCSRHGLSEQTFYRWRKRYGSTQQVDGVAAGDAFADRAGGPGRLRAAANAPRGTSLGRSARVSRTHRGQRSRCAGARSP